MVRRITRTQVAIVEGWGKNLFMFFFLLSVAIIFFGLTIVRDLTAGIVAGCLLAALFWAASKLHRKLARP